MGLADGAAPTAERVAPRLGWNRPDLLSILCEDGNVNARGVSRLYVVAGTDAPRVCLEISAPGPEAWRVEDTLALPGHSGALVLDVLDGRGRLMLIRGDGSTIWRTGTGGAPALPEGTWQLLVADADNGLWLAGRHGEVLRLNPATGATSAGVRIPPWDGRAVAGPNGRIFVVRYDPRARQRFWTCFDPSDGSATSVAGDLDAYPFLAQPIGADESGRVYGASYTDVMPEVACIGRSGRQDWRLDLGALRPPGRVQASTSWAVAGDGAVLIPSQTDAGLIVSALRP